MTRLSNELIFKILNKHYKTIKNDLDRLIPKYISKNKFLNSILLNHNYTIKYCYNNKVSIDNINHLKKIIVRNSIDKLLILGNNFPKLLYIMIQEKAFKNPNNVLLFCSELHKMSNLNSLVISNISGIKLEYLCNIGFDHIPHLYHLCMSNCDLNDIENNLLFNSLIKLKYLQILNLSHNNIRDEHIINFCKSATKLNIKYNFNYLNLIYNLLTENSIIILLNYLIFNNNMPDLKTLLLCGNSIYFDLNILIDYLNAFKKLKQISINYIDSNNILQKKLQTKKIIYSSKLVRLVLTHNNNNVICHNIKNIICYLPNLRYLDLNNNALTDDAIYNLSKILKKLINLRILTLNNNLITDIGVKYLCKGLKSILKLYELELNDNIDITNKSIKYFDKLFSTTSFDYFDMLLLMGTGISIAEIKKYETEYGINVRANNNI